MNKEEIFEIMNGKDVVEVYRQFQKLENSIDDSNELYEYVDDFISLLRSKESKVRIRAFRILCKLSRWDVDNKIEDNIEDMLNVLDDDKGTIVRQGLSYLNILLLFKPDLAKTVCEKIVNIDLKKNKDTLSPLIKKDIDYIINHF